MMFKSLPIVDSELILTQLCQISLLVIAVGIYCRFACRHRPFLAHGLWLIVIVKCLTPPVIVSVGGVFCWFPAVDVAQPRSIAPQPSLLSQVPVDTQARSEPKRTEEVTIQYRESMMEESHIDSRSLSQDTELASLIPPPVAKSERPEASITTWSGWTELGLCIWLGGCVVIVVWTMIRTRLVLHRAVRHAIEIPPDVSRCFEAMRKRLSVRASVSLIVTREPVSPVVYGVRSPRLIVSYDLLADGDQTRWKSIFAHELIHARRGDVMWCWVTFVGRAIWWFHPLVHWAAKRWSIEAERCCDEVVVAELRCSPATYAHHLLDVYQWKQKLTNLAPLPGIRKQDVTRKRLERIMKLGQGSRSRMPWWSWPVFVMFGLIVLPGGAVSLASPGSVPQSETAQDEQSGIAAGKDIRFDERSARLLQEQIAEAIGFGKKQGPYYLREDVQFLPRPSQQPSFRTHGVTLPDGGRLSRAELANIRNLQLKAQRATERLQGGVKLPAMTPSQNRSNKDQTPTISEQPSTKKFDVGPAIARVEQLDGCSREDAIARVKHHLGSILNPAAFSLVESSWENEQLTVTGVNRVLLETEQAIQRLAKYGLATYMIEIAEYRAPKKMVSELTRGWSFVPSQLPEGWNGVGPEFTNAWANKNADKEYKAEFSELDQDVPASLRIAGSSVQTVISRTVPLRQLHLDEESYEQLQTSLGDARVELASFPRVMVHNGQVAKIMTGSQRPFVTSMIPIENENGKQSFQPVITVLESGTTVHVRPIATDDGLIHLDAKLVFSHIGDVEVHTFDPVEQKDKNGKIISTTGTSLQVPVFSSTKVAVSTEVPADGAYAVAGMTSPDEEDDQRIIVVFKVKAISGIGQQAEEATIEKSIR